MMSLSQIRSIAGCPCAYRRDAVVEALSALLWKYNNRLMPCERLDGEWCHVLQKSCRPLVPEEDGRLAEVLRLVAEERSRQDAKWGEQNHYAAYWLAILMEEVGELAKVVVDWSSFGERRSMTAAETEAVQVAAVAVAMVECWRRMADQVAGQAVQP